MTYYPHGPRVRSALAEFNPDLVHVMYGGVMADQVTRPARVTSGDCDLHGSDLLGENLFGPGAQTDFPLRRSVAPGSGSRGCRVVVVARHLLRALPLGFPRPSDGRRIKGEGLGDSTLTLKPQLTKSASSLAASIWSGSGGWMCWDAGTTRLAGRRLPCCCLFPVTTTPSSVLGWHRQRLQNWRTKESRHAPPTHGGKKPGGPGVAECEQRIAADLAA